MTMRILHVLDHSIPLHSCYTFLRNVVDEIPVSPAAVTSKLLDEALI